MKELQKGTGPAKSIAKYSRGSAFALFGLFGALFSADFLSDELIKQGINDPLVKSLAFLTIDALSLVSASYGLFTFYSKSPGESFLRANRRVLLSITDSVENAITLLGFFGTATVIGFHLAGDEYRGLRTTTGLT